MLDGSNKTHKIYDNRDYAVGERSSIIGVNIHNH